MRAVAQFNVALEHVAEVAVVLVVGALLAWVQWDWRMAWFVPVLFCLCWCGRWRCLPAWQVRRWRTGTGMV